MPPVFRTVLILLLLAAPSAARAKDDLVIGLTQYPSSLHPNIDSMMAKTYVLGMGLRPLTAFDADWRLTCMLCERLPTFENGLARRETTPDGKPGVALTYTLRADLFWGDGQPVVSDDVAFTWEVGRHPRSGVANAEMYRRILGIEVKDAKTFTVHLDRLTFDYNALNDLQPTPAHVERPRFAAAPAEYRNRNGYDHDPTNPGLYNGPYRIGQVVQGSHPGRPPGAPGADARAGPRRTEPAIVRRPPAGGPHLGQSARRGARRRRAHIRP